MKLVDSIRGSMKRIISEEVDKQLLQIGFCYKEISPSNIVLEGYIQIDSELAKVTIVDNHRLCIEVYDYDECRYGVRFLYEFTEDTSLFALVQNAIIKENR